jgi:hypothetical protein
MPKKEGTVQNGKGHTPAPSANCEELPGALTKKKEKLLSQINPKCHRGGLLLACQACRQRLHTLAPQSFAVAKILQIMKQTAIFQDSSGLE